MSQPPSKLERRARTLLRVYPAEYRHGRAEEMIGTLLEAAPPGRSFPTVREAWSLIAGGRHARADRNRRPGVKANVRLALVLGISTYLSFCFCDYIAATLGFMPGSTGASYLTITTGALGLAVALSPWVGSQAVTTALAIPAGMSVAYGDLSQAHGSGTIMLVAECLVPMAALAVLSGAPMRLPRSWLCLPCAFPLALAVGRMLPSGHVPGIALENSVYIGALVLLAVLVVCWLVTDPRPAFAVGVAVFLYALMNALLDLSLGPAPMTAIAMMQVWLIQFAIVLPFLLPAAWLLLRRQKPTTSARSLPER